MSPHNSDETDDVLDAGEYSSFDQIPCRIDSPGGDRLCTGNFLTAGGRSRR